jgi:protease IV
MQDDTKKQGCFLTLIKWLGKTIAGTLVAMIAAAFALAVLLAFLAAALTMVSDGMSGELEPGTQVLLRFDETVPEAPSRNWISETFSFLDILDVLDAVADDDNVAGLIIDLDTWRLSSEQTEELVSPIQRIKAAGKRVYAYGSRINNHSYMIAAVADEIIMPPTESAHVTLTGYNISLPYYKTLTEKLGIDVAVLHVGDFKAFGENYSRTNMSEELRGELVKILDQRHADFIAHVAEHRGIETQALASLVMEGTVFDLPPEEARRQGLIDRTAYYHELLEELAPEGEDSAPTVGIDDYPIAESSDDAPQDKIAVLFAEGDILDRTYDSLFGADLFVTPAGIRTAVEAILEDDDVKGVVLRVNSPGGSALASELILQQLNRLKAKYPLVVSMGPVAASGGYYIACQGGHILAGRRTLTGSIGVVALVPKLKGMADKAGVNVESVTKGQFADLYNSTRELREEDLGVIRRGMQRVYGEFTSRVSEGRNIPKDKLEAIAQGRVWTGDQAREVGLVDAIGGLQDAIAEAADRADIEAYSVVSYPEPKGLLELISDGDFIRSRRPGIAVLPEIREYLRALHRARVLGHRPLYLLPTDLPDGP